MDVEPLRPTAGRVTSKDIAPHTRISGVLDDKKRTRFVGGNSPDAESYRYSPDGPQNDSRSAPIVNKSGTADVTETEKVTSLAAALRIDTAETNNRAGIITNAQGCGKMTRISPYDVPKGGHALGCTSYDQSVREPLANDPEPPRSFAFASDGSSFVPYRNDDYSHEITPVSTWDESLTCPASSQPATPSIHPLIHRGVEDEDEELANIQSEAPIGAWRDDSSARASGRRNPAIPRDENAVPFGEQRPPSSSKMQISRRDSSPFLRAARRSSASRRRSSKGRGILLDATNVKLQDFEPVGTPREKEDVRSPTSIATRGGTPRSGAARGRVGFF